MITDYGTLDRDLAVAGFSMIRQRPTESISDFAQRVTISVDNYRLLGLDIPSDGTQATRFMQGLSHARYSSLQTYIRFCRELNLELELTFQFFNFYGS